MSNRLIYSAHKIKIKILKIQLSPEAIFSFLRICKNSYLGVKSEIAKTILLKVVIHSVYLFLMIWVVNKEKECYETDLVNIKILFYSIRCQTIETLICGIQICILNLCSETTKGSTETTSVISICTHLNKNKQK